MLPQTLRSSPRMDAIQAPIVAVIGDLIRDRAGKAVDANHLPPWLKARPTGDCIEGGTFHSWFTAR